MKFVHEPVLKNETINLIFPTEKYLHTLLAENEFEFRFVDATFGAGGHSCTFIEKFLGSSFSIPLKFIAFDRDENAIKCAYYKLEKYKNKNFSYEIYHNNFSDISEKLNKNLNRKIHAFLADFGVSSPQPDCPERGFSIINDGPLDMRMDHRQTLTARSILLTYSQPELERIFFNYGEEPRSKKLAKNILLHKNTWTENDLRTHNFAEYVKQTLAYPNRSRIHPATRVFQALRIEVNQELYAIETLLQAVPSFMHPLGKASFISFHSLEDRLVKHAMRNWQSGYLLKKDNPINNIDIPKHILYLFEKKRSIGFGKENPRGGCVASEHEALKNPRARSARLRCFEFLNEALQL